MPQLRHQTLEDYVERVGEANDRRVVPVTDWSLTEYLDGRAYTEWANHEDTETFDSYINIGGVSIGL